MKFINKLNSFLFIILIFTIFTYSNINEIRNVQIHETPNHVEFLVSFSASDFEYYPATVGNLVRVDFPNTRFGRGEISESVYRGTVMMYRTEYIDTDRNSLRLLITMTDPTPVDFEKTASSLKITISKSRERSVEETSLIDAEDKVDKMKAQAAYSNATEAMRVKEWNKAHQYLKDAVTLAPDNEEIRDALNIVQEKVMEQKVLDSRLKEAFELFTQGDYLRTVDVLERFNEQHGKTAESTYYLARAYYEVKDYKKAKNMLEYLINNHSDYEFISSAQMLLERAEYYISNKLVSDDLIDFSAENKSVPEVISSLLYGTGYKYEMQENITRQINVDIRKKSLKEALDIVAKAGGFEYEIENQIVKIRQKRIEDNLVSELGFKDMVIGDVLNAIADFMQVNIILSPDIDKSRRITFFIENAAISLEEFFDLVLKSNDLTAIEYNENTFYIEDSMKAKTSDYRQRHPAYFDLQYISPEEALYALKSVRHFRDILDFDNISIFDFDKNTAIIKNETNFGESDDRTSRYERALERLTGIEEDRDDLTARDDLIERYVDHTVVEASRGEEIIQEIETITLFENMDVAKPETSLNSYDVKISDMRASQRKVKMLFAYETRDNIEIIESFLEQIDVKRQQVLISMKVMEVNSNYTDDLGIETTFDGSKDSLNVSKLSNVNELKLESTLNFLEENNKGRLIASPTIRVLDGHSANIDIFKTITLKTKEAKEVSVPGSVTDSVSQTGGTDWKIVDIYRDVDLGLKMEVMPVVNKENEITIDVSVNETAESGTTPEGILIIANRSTDTVARLGDGETVVMGGLINKRESTSRRNVPVFSRLPLVGRFFRQKEQVEEVNEMVIFLSAYLVDEDGEKSEVDIVNNIQNDESDFSNVVNELRYKLDK
ncbi:MAG: hypothetical protein ACQESP_03665 [Candidatus Muiribacteriota bacterium]